MPTALFPERFDDRFNGSRASVWLLGLLAAVKCIQGINVMLQPHKVLSGVDRVPLDTFPADATAHLEFLFAVWGLFVTTLGALGLLAVLRYRAMIPLALLLLLIEQVGRMALASAYMSRPFFPTSLTAAAAVNLSFLAIAAVGLVLSLWRPRASHPLANLR